MQFLSLQLEVEVGHFGLDLKRPVWEVADCNMVVSYLCAVVADLFALATALISCASVFKAFFTPIIHHKIGLTLAAGSQLITEVRVVNSFSTTKGALHFSLLLAAYAFFEFSLFAFWLSFQLANPSLNSGVFLPERLDFSVTSL